MAAISLRYRSAVHSKSLRPDSHKGDEGPASLDVDTLGGYGLADKRLNAGWVTTGPDLGYHILPAPLAVPLERLLAGDHRVVHEVVAILAEMAWYEARRMSLKFGRSQAHDIACCCIAWQRNGTCRSCGGHGYDLIPGAPMLSDHKCKACDGAGKIPFEEAIDPTRANPQHRVLARWLLGRMEMEMGKAGSEAMKAIAKRMDL